MLLDHLWSSSVLRSRLWDLIGGLRHQVTSSTGLVMVGTSATFLGTEVLLGGGLIRSVIGVSKVSGRVASMAIR